MVDFGVKEIAKAMELGKEAA